MLPAVLFYISSGAFSQTELQFSLIGTFILIVPRIASLLKNQTTTPSRLGHLLAPSYYSLTDQQARSWPYISFIRFPQLATHACLYPEISIHFTKTLSATTPCFGITSHSHCHSYSPYRSSSLGSRRESLGSSTWLDLGMFERSWQGSKNGWTGGRMAVT
ncbi:hypothetical protein ASPBRDRAFT_331861 [Aspergillus brasiliensis CBS 101740]|uniref:Uncharacterized protein n=1 Tax=Aspergillus brasiliensis (strain CBS 101740 / IMI 381727 / IBT 21946) TaxID=767769 RepID=A0A1L9U8R1_ASPBC|nr:hypothetical protein ASPBRDRAFT_331861 [Aspergillus brasiliensis CBS 101740]